MNLSGDPSLASDDAAVLSQRLARWGYAGSARALDGGIEVTVPMPAGVSPQRIVDRLLVPGRLSFRAEVAANGNHETVQDCSAGPDACTDVSVGPAHLTSADVAEVAPVPALNGGAPALMLRFTEDGAARIRQVSRDLVGQRMVIEVDGQVVSRPTIQEPIEDGVAVIHLSGGLHGQQLHDPGRMAQRIMGPPLKGDWTPAD